MKPLLFLLLSLSVQAGDFLRLVGTNIYDFSAIAYTTNRATPYRLVGLVDHVYPLSVKVLVSTGRYEYRFEPLTASTEPNEMLAWFAAAKIGEKPISPGKYLTLSPLVAQYFQRHLVTADAYVLNCPFRVKENEMLEVLCIPTKIPQYYDCGIEFRGSLTNGQAIHKVYLNRIVVSHVTNALSEVRIHKLEIARPDPLPSP